MEGRDPLHTPMDHQQFLRCELEIEGYDCRSDSGSGSDGTFNMDYIISPPLPDDYSEWELTFREYEQLPERRSTGNKVMIHLEKAKSYRADAYNEMCISRFAVISTISVTKFILFLFF